MNRKDLLFTGGVALAGAMSSGTLASAASQESALTSTPNLGKPLSPPKVGLPRVALLLGPDTVAIDAIGPWEAFTNATAADGNALFMTYCVAETMHPVSVEGLWITPHYTFENVPQPHVVIIPEQRNLPASIEWVKHVSAHTDVVMSVCTGAFLLARTGLLDGLTATTHHGGYARFEREFPKIKLIRGPRYVENREVSTAGGESSGIDLALRVVERYYGPQAAAESSYNMEHVRRARPQSIHDV
jgi:transcriptional regulator GlxA family with amidase domain